MYTPARLLRFVFILSIPFFILSTSSCRTKHKKTAKGVFDTKKFDEDDVADVITSAYENRPIDDSAWAKEKIHSVASIMQNTYHAYEYLPLWLNEDGDTKAIEQFLKELNDLQNDGLDPKRYNAEKLQTSFDAIKKEAKPAAEQLAALDTALTSSYLHAAHDLLFGAVSPKDADSLWFHTNDTTWAPEKVLEANLYEKNQYPSLDSFRSHVPTYISLRKTRTHYTGLEKDNAFIQQKKTVADGTADSVIQYIVNTEVPWLRGEASDSVSNAGQLLKAYQQYYGLKTTGKKDSATIACLSRLPGDAATQIDINLERIRWMGRDIEPLYILVNVPLMELFLRKDGHDEMHMNVVVGKPIRQTPSLNAKMVNVVINPPWGVPPTILKKDIGPGIAKSGAAAYLGKKGLKAYDSKNREVSPSQVTAANYKKFFFKQPPGDDNSLGYVKFNLPNKWDIYLHDTPHREDFTQSYRAKSSGCIRVQQPREMAEYILSELNGKYFTQGKLDTMISTKKTTYETLTNRIPVHIVYLTAFDDSTYTHTRFVKDIYKRDAKLVQLLKQG
jgi:murein L,D-transpeptidase YcbB/YkuD